VDPTTGKQLPQRIIRMVEVAQDPLDPPKFRHRKVPAGFNDAPVPILHSPPRKVTVQDMQDWKIPPCISNWKNARGLVIPLDKRLAADGRGLQQTQVNDRFADFANAMQAVERKMCEEVELRNSIIRKQKEREKLSEEEQMRKRAAEIRQQREDMERAHDER
jgi:SNW domain-containing protein 1